MWKWRISRSLSVGFNPMALSGVLLGLISVFIPWVVIQRGWWFGSGWPPIFEASETLSYVSLVFGEPPFGLSYVVYSMRADLLFFTFLAVFLLGLILSIGSTFGGLPMAVGLIGQVLFGRSYFRDYFIVYDVSFAVGFYLALVSSAILLTCWGHSVLAGDEGQQRGTRLLGQTVRLIREDGSNIIVIGREGARRRAWRANALCLLGVSMGIAAVFMTWIVTRGLGHYLTPSGRHWFSYLLDWPSVDMMLVSALCLAGLALSTLSPLGGFLQIAGGAGCIAYLSYHLPMFWMVGIGPYIMVLSGIIVVLSAGYPVWIGSDGRAPGPLARFFTWNSFKRMEARGDVPLGEQESLRKVSLERYHRYDVRTNSVAFLAAVLGAVSLFLSWVRWENEPYACTVLDLLVYSSGQLAVVAGIFVAGVALLFLTPAGGILQVVSIPLVLLALRGTSGGDYSLNSGIALGFLSAALAVFALAVPAAWDDERPTRTSLRKRLMNVVVRKMSDAQQHLSDPATVSEGSEESKALDEEGRVNSARVYFRNFVRINMLSLVGALIAMVSVFVYWIDVLPGVSGINLPGLLEIRSLDLDLVVLLFMVGTVMAFVTPFGGVLQLIGASTFFVVLYGQEGISPSIGPYLGLIAALTAIAGGLLPVGIGYGKGLKRREKRLRTRLITVTFSETALVFVPPLEDRTKGEEDGQGQLTMTSTDSGEMGAKGL